ncbi:MAG: uncharacterized protein KVP18_004508 [Porospora cf. gigantea A]|uniref:uncharacterized protein n=1 Tax=Porospora cf. gigantea A TaxID=2853593 RepID=UPI00355A1148|nr:MAG: hypothetical protein KVP18_004508 [Porospora cf. gigantea A]
MSGAVVQAQPSILPLALVEKCIGNRIWIIMRNDREFVGRLCGFDDYLNLVLEDCTEVIPLPEGVPQTMKQSSMLLNGNNIAIMVPGGCPDFLQPEE